MSEKKSNPRQIVRFMNNKVLLAFQDNMQVETGENASAIHNQYSKVRMTLMDYSQGKGTKAVIVNCNMDIDTVKYIAETILNGVAVDFKESKILSYKKDDTGKSPVIHVNIKYCTDEKTGQPLSSPWMFSVANGNGIADQTQTGGTVCRKGSYKKIGEVKVYMSEADCFKTLITVRDYIRNFEIVNFASLMKARAAYEESVKEQTEKESEE